MEAICFTQKFLLITQVAVPFLGDYGEVAVA
jgi:hypothetical protein